MILLLGFHFKSILLNQESAWKNGAPHFSKHLVQQDGPTGHGLLRLIVFPGDASKRRNAPRTTRWPSAIIGWKAGPRWDQPVNDANDATFGSDSWPFLRNSGLVFFFCRGCSTMFHNRRGGIQDNIGCYTMCIYVHIYNNHYYYVILFHQVLLFILLLFLLFNCYYHVYYYYCYYYWLLVFTIIIITIITMFIYVYVLINIIVIIIIIFKSIIKIISSLVIYDMSKILFRLNYVWTTMLV